MTSPHRTLLLASLLLFCLPSVVFGATPGTTYPSQKISFKDPLTGHTVWRMTVDGTQQGALNVMADSSGMELNAFSGDSTRICYAKTGHPSKPNGMYVMNILTGIETYVAPTGDNKLGSCAFSKTTNEIFYPYTDAGVAQEIRAVNLSTYAVRVLQRFNGADVSNSHISLNSDGSYLSVGFHAHNAFYHVMLKASDGTPLPNWTYDVSTPDEDGYGDYGYWHPTNPKLIRVSRDKNRAIWNVDTLAKVTNPTPVGLEWNLPGSHACWTLDGKIFFSVSVGHPDCYPLDIGKGEETRVVMDRFGGTAYPYLYFTPLKNLAGSGVYPAGTTGVIALHYTNNTEINGEVRYAHAHPHFSRDGKYILWSSPVTNTSKGSPPGGVGTSPYKVDLFIVPLDPTVVPTPTPTPPTPPKPTTDTTAPSTPIGISVTAVSPSQIKLSWSASTDNVRVTGYRLERCKGAGCTAFTQLTTVTGTTYSNLGLLANTSYTYRVRAVDAAGNLSGYSGTSGVTTLSGGVITTSNSTSTSTVFSTTETFSGNTINWQPLTTSRWGVLSDEGNARYALKTTSFSPLSGNRLGEYTLVKGKTYADFTLTAKVRTTENLTTNPGADYDVLFGFQDAKNYYYFMVNGTTSFSQLFKVVGGTRITLADATNLAIPDTAYHTVKVERSGSTITVFFDGAQKLQTTDTTFMTGRIGIGGFNDAAMWDDIRVTGTVVVADPPPVCTLTTTTSGTKRNVYFTGGFESGKVNAKSSTVDGFLIGTLAQPQPKPVVGSIPPHISVSAGGAGPTAAIDTKVVPSEIFPLVNGKGGEKVTPRAGNYFIRSALYKDKVYEGLNGATYPNVDLDKPRSWIYLTDPAHRFEYDDEVWVGFSIYVPKSFEHEDCCGHEGSYSTLATVSAEASATFWGLSIGRPNNSVAVGNNQWVLDVNTNAKSTFEADPSTKNAELLLGPVEADRGTWVDFVVRHRANPFSVATNPATEGIARAVNKTFEGNKGILQVWKSEGPADAKGNRKMVLKVDIENKPVGLVPNTQVDLYQTFRIYKFGWKKAWNNSTVTGPVWYGFDEIRMGFAKNGTGYKDVLPGSSGGSTSVCIPPPPPAPTPSPTPTAPTATFSALSTSISAGGASKLTWTSRNAMTCALSPSTGAIPSAGSVTVTPTNTTTYTLVCTGSGGAVTKSVTVSVKATPVTPPTTGSGVKSGDTNFVYNGNWRTTDDIVSGWDWTMPPNAKPAGKSGLLTINNDVYPAGWPGYKIRVINAKWKDLEPTPGNYDFSSITNYLNDPNYDGIYLNVRGFVTSIVDETGTNALPWEITAPSWLQTPVYQESAHNGYLITSLLIRDANVKARHLALVTALKNQGILTSPRIWAQMIHLPSSTRGEEFESQQGNAAATQAAAADYITAWVNAAGANAKRLLWTDDHGKVPALFDIAVTNGGTGARGGAIESWLWNAYTPGYKKYTQQTWSNGYLDVDESGLILSQGRGWLDENEVYTGANDPTDPQKQQNWRMASLRTLQMRRSMIWVDNSYRMNPAMSKWMSLEAGHDVSSAPDAWVSLMRTWTRSTNNGTANGDREIKNFERWLYQRDVTGAQTTPVINKDHGRNMSLNDALNPSLWNIDLARQGSVVGIAVDDRFIGNGANNVAIKVTYVDSTSNPWSLSYTKSNGTVGTRTIQRSGSGVVKTATFFLNDFSAPATGTNFDFKLLSPTGDTPFMFVRVIKLGANSNAVVDPSKGANGLGTSITKTLLSLSPSQWVVVPGYVGSLTANVLSSSGLFDDLPIVKDVGSFARRFYDDVLAGMGR